MLNLSRQFVANLPFCSNDFKIQFEFQFLKIQSADAANRALRESGIRLLVVQLLAEMKINAGLFGLKRLRCLLASVAAEQPGNLAFLQNSKS